MKIYKPQKYVFSYQTCVLYTVIVPLSESCVPPIFLELGSILKNQNSNF